LPRWAIAGAFGALSGLYCLYISYLPLRWEIIAIVPAAIIAIALVVGNLRRCLLAAVLFDIPLSLDVHLAYRADAASLGAVGGLSISVTTFALFGLYGLWLMELFAKARLASRPCLKVSVPFFAYVCVVALSVVMAPDVELAGFQLILMIQAFLLFLYIASTVRTQDDVTFIVSLLLLGVILEGLIMLAVRLAGHDLSMPLRSARLFVGTSTAGPVYRAEGTLGSYTVAASYLSLLLAPALSVLLTSLRATYKWLAVMAFLVGGGALLLTGTRGGWVAFGISVIVLYGLTWVDGRLSLKAIMPLGPLLALIPFLVQGGALARVLGDDKNSAYARLPLMDLALRVIRDHPLLGAGTNNFATVIKTYVTPEFGRAWVYTVHNHYLLVWAETGLAGLLTFLWAISLAVIRGYCVWRFRHPILSPLALGLTAALVGHLVHLSVDLLNDRMPGQLVWLFFGLGVAMFNMQDQDLATGGRTRR
jgi:putative inorganic carbon (hco3(-)) transporter